MAKILIKKNKLVSMYPIRVYLNGEKKVFYMVKRWK